MHSFYTWILIYFIISLLPACKEISKGDGTREKEYGYIFYKQGIASQERIQFLQALEAYNQAIHIGIASKDSCLLFQCYLQTCRVYRHQSLKDKALSAGKQAENYLHALQSDSLQKVLYGELGDLYALAGQSDSAYAYYDQAFLWSKSALLALKESDCNKAKTYLAKGTGTLCKKMPDDIALAFARLFLQTGKPDSATYYLSRVSSPNLQLFSYQAKLSELKGDTLQAAFYKKYLNQQYWASEIQKNEGQIAQLQWNMGTRSWEERLKKEQQSNRHITYLWSMVMLTGFAGGFFFIRRYRNRREIQQSETAFRSSEIYIRFHRKEEWKPKAQDWEELFHAFGQTYPGYYERLKMKVPQLTQSEWYMCCLIKMEVLPSTIAMLVCCTHQAISMRRTRLYQKITGEKGTPELFDTFIRDI